MRRLPLACALALVLCGPAHPAPASARRTRGKPAPAKEAPAQRTRRKPRVPAEVVLSTVPITLVYPSEGHAAPGPGQFFFGNVSHPRRPFRINGATVAVHEGGGFLAHVPVWPGNFTVRLEADLPGGTAVLERTLRGPEPAPALAPGGLEIIPDSVAPSEDVELRAGDWLRVRARGTPGLTGQFAIAGLRDPLPMAETRPGLYEGVYQASGRDVLDHARLTLSLRRGRSAVEVAARGRLTLPAEPPGVVAVRSNGIVNVKSSPGAGYVLFPPPGTRFPVTGRQGGELRLGLAPGLSGWVEERAVERLPPGTPPPRAVLGSASTSAGPDSTAVLLELSERIPFLIEEAEDLGSLRLRLFHTVAHLPWIVYDPADGFLDQLRWAQRDEPTVELTLRLSPGQLLWGYDASWSGAVLRLELRRPPAIAPAPASVFKGRAVVLDPGHMPSAPGAVGPRGTMEMDANFWLAKDLEALLVREGATVALTRSSEREEVSLVERPRIAWAKRGELFVSVHHNALPDGEDPFARPRGFSIFYFHPHSLPLARATYRAYERHAPHSGEGLRYGNLYVARLTQMPSILTESAYLMFPEQEELALDPARRKLLAKAMLEGLRDFLEAERKRQAAARSPGVPAPRQGPPAARRGGPAPAKPRERKKP